MTAPEVRTEAGRALLVSLPVIPPRRIAAIEAQAIAVERARIVAELAEEMPGLGREYPVVLAIVNGEAS